MKVLVFGETGQVARELARRCPTDVTTVFLGRRDAELSTPDACGAAVRTADADVVVNAAAWTAVDRAEVEEAAATSVNGEAPGAMASACAARDLPFLHLSTDYVFDGTGSEPFTPADAPAPLNAYGRSKLAGERAIRAAGGRHLVLRTSWVVSAHGSNFITTMLRLGRERESLRVVADQVGAPTPASAIADALYAAARILAGGHAGGTYHFAGTPDTTWADVARAVMSSAGLRCRIENISAAEYPAPARRPLNSRLDGTTFVRDFGVERPDWRAHLHDILKDLGACP